MTATHDTDQSNGGSPLDLAAVLGEELHAVKGHRIAHDDLGEIFKELHAANLTALCLSGGGIRSATFGLGIVQSLAKHGLLPKFDYLSTVSGGGYLGSWLSAWVLREKLVGLLSRWNWNTDGKLLEPTREDAIEHGSEEIDQTRELDDTTVRDFGIQGVQEKMNFGRTTNRSDPNPEPRQVRNLREYSNYMSPRTGLLSADTWTVKAIYLRNLFLNLTIFVPLIAAVLILPRFFFLVIGNHNVPDVVAYITLLAALQFGGLSMAFVISKLPSKQKGQSGDNRTASDSGGRRSTDGGLLKEETNPDDNTDVGVLKYGVLPLLLSAICTASLWAWNVRSGGRLYDLFDVLDLGIRENQNWTLLYFAIGGAVAFFLGGIHLLLMGGYRDGLAAFSAFVSTMVGAVLLWLIGIKLIGDGASFWQLEYAWPLFLCLAVPLFLLIVLTAATVFVGLTSRTASDEDREWLTRFGAWVVVIAGSWTFLNAAVLIGPYFLQQTFGGIGWNTFSWAPGMPAVISSLTALSAILTLVGGFLGKGPARDEPIKSIGSRLLAYATKIAAFFFLLFIIASLTTFSTWLLYGLSVSSTVDHLTSLQDVAAFGLVATFLGLAGTGLIIASFVNVNKFSLHGAYRDRLVRAYLGASNTRRRKNSFTGFDERDNFQLHRLKDQRPFHIINATVNLVGGKTLAWQNRKAASFSMSPLHCGSWTLGYRNTNEYCRNTSLGPCKSLDTCNQVGTKCELRSDGKSPDCQIPGMAIRLGTAMAISGAAANPNLGYFSSPVVTFLMSLFNIRLGWWLGNTGEAGSARDWFGLGTQRFFEKTAPSIGVLSLLNELFGRTDENKRFLMVTDGGHFENLALYEMVLRRCRLIVLSDCATSPSFKFGEIANAIQKCKVDLGVDINFIGPMNTSSWFTKEEGEIKGVRFALAEIMYPERDGDGKSLKGYLLYTRPAYYGTTEPPVIRHYADSNGTFPNQSTGDQMHDEKQFEAYRGLGYLTMTEIREVVVATALGEPENLVDDELEDLFEKEVDMRRTVFEFFGVGDPQNYAPRKKSTGDQ